MAHFLFRLSGAALRAALLYVAMAAGVAFSTPASAVGRMADITVIDRDSGQVLPVHSYQGRHYVAGRPGARYAVRVYNRSNARVMAVIAVDGVNVVSGDTASWEQNGYVFGSWQRHDIAGWRKSQAEVAAFEFTALPNSYAARTGRPENVGVIGVAVFRELMLPPPPAAPPTAVTPPIRPNGGVRGRDDAAGGMRREAESSGPAAASSGPHTADASAQSARKSEAESGAAASVNSTLHGNASGASGATASAAEGRALARPAPQAETKLGTGHGQRENAWVSYTEFQRAQSVPNEVIAIYYDSRENLIAQGVIAVPRLLPAPQPFPAQPQLGFVPDPPRY